MYRFFAQFNISRKWLISTTLIVVLAIFTLVYSFNQFYRLDSISLEVLQGNVTKSSQNQKNTIAARGSLLFPGDSVEVSKDGALAMIFHDGSTISFKAGEIIKYENFDLKDKKNYFNFSKPSQNQSFEYVTESYLNKTGAVILGRQNWDAKNDSAKSKVLGISDKIITDADKIKLWDSLNDCIQKGKTELTYSKLLQKCQSQNNLSKIENLNN